MLKPFILSLAALFAFNVSSAMESKPHIYLPDGKTLEEVQNAQKTVVYSLYNVLHERKQYAYLLACLKHPVITLFSLIPRYAAAYITGKPNSLTQTLAEKENLKPFTSAEGYIQYFKEKGENGLAAIAQDAALLVKPTQVTEIVEELNQENVVQRIVSNVGPNILTSLAQRFKSVYKNGVFDILRTGLIADYRDFGPDKTFVNHGEVQTTKNLKTKSEFYQEYNKIYNPNNDSITVHVCDNEEMLKQAQKDGWAGIQFDIKTATVEQLRDHLAQLGLPIKKYK